VAVLGTTMIVGSVALCGMHLARSELKAAQVANDREEARVFALSAIDHAVSMMDFDPNWRSNYTNGVEVGPWTLDGNPFSWKLVDDDGSLSNDPTDPVWVYGYGRVGEAAWTERALVRPDRGQPLEALNTCLHCSGELHVKAGKTLVVSGAPASTDGNLRLDGAIAGDAHAVSKSGGGMVSGSLTLPAARKGVAWPTIFNTYVAKATTLTGSGDLAGILLAPGVNES
jgi:hypothetical protein